MTVDQLEELEELTFEFERLSRNAHDLENNIDDCVSRMKKLCSSMEVTDD